MERRRSESSPSRSRVDPHHVVNHGTLPGLHFISGIIPTASVRHAPRSSRTYENSSFRVHLTRSRVDKARKSRNQNNSDPLDVALGTGVSEG
jgi:hypothetical protein